jgi:RNA 2',3'-cyclic 3'-phosphodiesterase
MRPPTLRLFIGLWPHDAVRSKIARWQAEWEWPERASLVGPERFHTTLHFLGDVAPERVLDLKYVLKPVPTPPFELHFARPEIWQHGVAVLRPDNSPTALRGLHARIGLALAEIGLPVDEKPYRPHVTLARRATGAKPPARAPDIQWEANAGFVLVQSLGGGRGYEILERFGT